MAIDKRYNRDKPTPGTLLLSEEARNNFQALERSNELRPILATVIDPDRVMALYVEAGYYANSSAATAHFNGGFSNNFDSSTIPHGGERTDALVITAGGSLLILEGTAESTPGTSLPPLYSSNSIPIAEVVMPSGAVSLADPTVTIRDVRPMFITSASGFGINPIEEVLIAKEQGQTVFNLTTFTYSPGDYELNVFVGGVRKNAGEDYVETSTSELTFVTGLPVGEKVVVWKVGSASKYNLADLDDVTVDQAQSVIDPDGNRPNVASRNNPFATLLDIKGGAEAIPFGVQHNDATGEHGPQVSIVQPADDIALIVNKNHTGGTGAVISVTNSGSAPGVHVVQVGDGIGINLLHAGANNAVAISDTNTGSDPALYIDRVVTLADRQSFIRLDDTGSSKTVDVSFYNNEITFDDNASSTHRIKLNANLGTITLTHNTGSSANLTITKSGTNAAGRSINVTHSGAGEAFNIEHLSTTATPAIRINRASTTSEAMRVDGILLDPLWSGSSIVADTLHTHKFGTKRSGATISTPILSDLVDVTSAQSSAFGSAHSPSAGNPFATINDINNKVPRTKFGTYTGNGTSQSINVGFEPDWVMLYNGDDHLQSGAYAARGGTGRYFSTAGTASITLTATGFNVSGATGPVNQSTKNYFYIAIKGDSLPVVA